METSLWFDTLNLEWSIVYMEGSHIINSKLEVYFSEESGKMGPSEIERAYNVRKQQTQFY